jgi:prepilin-type N-terminal cleavage/methylation domain-containing protein
MKSYLCSIVKLSIYYYNVLMKKKGFTLIELIIVIAILVILAVIALPSLSGLIDRSRIAADQSFVAELNRITAIYRIDQSDEDPFENTSNTSLTLMKRLIDAGYLNEVYTVKSRGGKIEWFFDREKWHLAFDDPFYVISEIDGIVFDSSGWFAGRISGSYSGDSRDIVIPSQIDGVPVSMIYQDVFKGKNLISVEFQEGISIEHIHARAFFDNDIAQIDLPDTIERIDLWAFRNNNISEISLPANLHTIESRAFDGNDITKITIGSDVDSIGERAFGKETESFISAYDSDGAGTYELLGGVWVKR